MKPNRPRKVCSSRTLVAHGGSRPRTRKRKNEERLPQKGDGILTREKTLTRRNRVGLAAGARRSGVNPAKSGNPGAQITRTDGLN